MTKVGHDLIRGRRDDVAVVAGGRRATYGELKERSSALAAGLRCAGISAGAIVGIYAGRTIETIVAMLGIWKSGASYTIADAGDTSRSTLARLGGDVCALTLSTADGDDGLARLGVRTRRVADLSSDERFAARGTGDDDDAYVLFTSGSTGTPKGVVVTHGNIHHYTSSLVKRLRIESPVRCAHVSSLAADLGHTSIFASLASGGTLHLFGDEERRDPSAFWARLANDRIELLKITPSHWRVMLEAAPAEGGHAAPLEYLILGGESLSPALLERTYAERRARRIVNHYGPTETTVGVALNAVTPADLPRYAARKSIPVGKPFGATRMLARTEAGEFRDRDATGELYVGGPSVAKGYLNNREATEARFVRGIEGDTRFYRTGDLVTIDADGEIEFLGRVDRQVKVRGHRVELEHVESALRRAPGVAASFATCVGVAGHERLVAAVVLEGDASPDDVKRAVAAELPPYMVPSTIVALAAFPMNGNGKVDGRRLAEAIEREARGIASAAPEPPRPANDAVVDDVLSVWGRHLMGKVGGLDEDFFDLGGDSIAAIQVIAELQRRGYEISSSSFQRGFTVRETVEAIRRVAGGTERAVAPHDPADGALSPAQRTFFEWGLAQPDRWNQCLLLESSARLDPVLMATAVSCVVRRHPLLRSQFHHTDRGWAASARPDADAIFTSSNVERADGGALQRAIYTASNELHRAIRLTGPLFRVHLFATEDARDRLLLVAHHLVVDAVSWHAIVGDLSRAYASAARGEGDGLSDACSVADWVAHVERHRDELRADLETWRSMPEPRAPRRDRDGPNVEGAARVLWFALSAEQTGALERRVKGCGMHAIVLGAFAEAMARVESLDAVTIEVESHGRHTFDGTMDVSRAVGWFTSVFPVVVGAREGASTEDTVRAAQDVLGRVPRHGLAAGWFRGDASGPPAVWATPRVCYNYLGRWRFPAGDTVAWKPSRDRLAPARGELNDRVHDWKITGRVLDDRLVVDLSYSVHQYETSRLLDLLRETKRVLARLADAPWDGEVDVTLDEGSNTGHLTYFPLPARVGPPPRGPAQHRTTLLTGATGYIGVHLLRALLHQTPTDVACLVRRSRGQSGWERLARAYGWFFEGESLDSFKGRLRVLEGSLAEDDFGLDRSSLSQVAEAVDAIYHLGADTRLFGDRAAIERCNVESTKTVLRMASAGLPKQVHFMSTLAVCGVNRSGREVVFTERNLDVGQGHLNAYEQSKFHAEQLVRAYALAGGSAFVYRAGNVSGHSKTGRFQRNADDNRFVQLLRGLAYLGKRPDDGADRIALTPVDEVVAAMCALRERPHRQAVFHVDAGTSFSMTEVLNCLGELGLRFEGVAESRLPDLLRTHGDARDTTIDLAQFWASREERNVRFDHEWTHRELDAAGFRFQRVDGAWLRRLVSGLLSSGALAPAARVLRAADDHAGGTHPRDERSLQGGDQ